jgi:glycosyltransferase involved in cell wall biosynthesis
MKILQVISYFPPAYAFGGSVQVAFFISKGLVNNGHEVVVYTTDAKDFKSRFKMRSNENIDGIKVYRFRNLSMMLVKLKIFITPGLFFHLRSEREKFDIIHLHDYRTIQNIVVYFYAKKHGIPYVLHSHNSLVRTGALPALKQLYDVLFGYTLLRGASMVIALSTFEAEQYKLMGVPDERIAIIPNGIDLSEYANLPPPGSFSGKFNIQKNKKIILYLGRINKYKGIDFLIKATAHLINDCKYDDIMLVIAGFDDGYLGEIKKQIHLLNIEKNVLLTGKLTEIEKISAFVDADVVVNVEPSNVFGMIPLEAAACSTPVIVSDGNSVKDIVKKGGFGFSVKYNDISELAETMRRIIDDNSLGTKMGQKGREFVFENFDWADVIVKLVNIYEAAKRKYAYHDPNSDNFKIKNVAS